MNHLKFSNIKNLKKSIANKLNSTDHLIFNINKKEKTIKNWNIIGKFFILPF
jgi:hypothetical protein